jgi:SAM-dependent methyltransferase
MVGLVRYVVHRARLRAADEKYKTKTRVLPPPRLRHRVHGALEDTVYVQAGEVISRAIVETWRRFSSTASPTVLDFGCGPGRVIVPFKALVPGASCFGTDIDAEAIGWAKQHLSHLGRFDCNAPLPPLRFGDSAFDLVYSVSVFTHLNENDQLLWLRELHRVVRKDGCVIASVHGALARASCSPSELERLSENGFVYRTDRRGLFKLDGLPDFYQTTFHSKDYVSRVWSRYFEVLEHVEGGLAGHQDLVVLRPR